MFMFDLLLMFVVGFEVGEVLVLMFKDYGVGFYFCKVLVCVDEVVRMMYFGDGMFELFDLFVVVFLYVFFVVVWLVGFSEFGWIFVDLCILFISVDNVWVIGDVIVLMLLNGKLLFKVVVFVEVQVVVVVYGVVCYFGYDVVECYFIGMGVCYVEIGDYQVVKGDGDFFVLLVFLVMLYLLLWEFYEEKVV